MTIYDVRTYQILIHGQVEEADIRPTSPLQFMVERGGETGTAIKVRTDQSGIIGLIRHLHGLGLVIIEMHYEIK